MLRYGTKLFNLVIYTNRFNERWQVFSRTRDHLCTR